jgi:chromate reductase
MSSGRLLGICGSLRKDSFNRKLMLEAKRLFDPAEFDDANLRLPLYDGDLETELRASRRRCRSLADRSPRPMPS